MEHTDQEDLEYHCEDQCGHTCYQLNADDFVDHEACERNGFHTLFSVFKVILDQMTTLDQIFVELCVRIMYGDLRKYYQDQVLNARDGDVREAMMSVKNVVCGNIELECAYAAWEHWETVQEGRNIFEKLGK